MTTAAEQGRRKRAPRGSRPSKAQEGRGDGSNGRPEVAGASALTSALHVLDGHLHPLTDGAHPFRHPSRRYEDLCLIERVIRLERDLLDTATESEAESATLSALSTAIEVSLKRLAWDLERSGRWLSEKARKRAEEAAARRFDAIAAELAREQEQAPHGSRRDGSGRERGAQIRQSPGAAADAPRPAPWPALVAIASQRAAIASRRMSIASRRASGAFRAQLERVTRLASNHGITQAQAVRAVAVAAGLAALAGIAGGLSGGSPGVEGGNAYGSPGSGALRATSPDGHVAALAALGKSTSRGIARSHDRRHSGHGGRGQSHGGNAGGGGGSIAPTGVSGKGSGTGTPYTGSDSTPVASSPAPAPFYPSVSAPAPTSGPTSSSDGPVTSTVQNVDQTASDAGVNTGASGATSGVTGQVDQTVNDLSNDVSGTTDGLLGN